MAWDRHHAGTAAGTAGKLFDMRAWVYILRCSDGTFYTGWTNDPDKRLAAHNRGTASKYTRGRRPVELIFKKEFQTKEEAMSCEAKIKSLDRKEKLRIALDNK